MPLVEDVIYVLIRDYGRDGISVHGATRNLNVAKTWNVASSDCKYIRIELNEEITSLPLLYYPL